MVALQVVRAANAQLRQQTGNLVSVFVGATSGIGRGTVTALAKSADSPKVYLVGRSAASAAELLGELRALNPQGTFLFVEAQVSLLRDVDRICEEIKQQEKKLDLLFLSAGALNAVGRQETPEGLDITLSVTYYSRMRFIVSLLPLLSASPAPRVLSLLGAGKEAPLVLDDLELKTHYSLANEANQAGTMNPFFMQHLAAKYPKISFVYTFPGFVNTDLLNKTTAGLTGPWAALRYVVKLVVPVMMKFMGITADEAGERALYALTSEKFRTEGKLKRLDWNQEDAVAVRMLNDAEISNTVSDHTEQVFARILGSK